MRDLTLVEIYIKINFTKENIGSYTSVLKYNDKIKILKNSHMIDKTPNRILIRAIIESIEKLKLPSNIVLNTNTAWGGKAILSKDGTIKIKSISSKHNADLKNQVRDLLIKNSHTLNLVINKDINNSFILVSFISNATIVTPALPEIIPQTSPTTSQQIDDTFGAFLISFTPILPSFTLLALIEWKTTSSPVDTATPIISNTIPKVIKRKVTKMAISKLTFFNTKVENNVITTDIENAKIVTIKLHR